MVDVSNIRVGDEVTVKAKVVRVDHSPRYPVCVEVDGNGPHWIKADIIVSHTPAPREFNVGDTVRAPHDRADYELVAIRGDSAFLWFMDQQTARVARLSDLRHADDAP